MIAEGIATFACGEVCEYAAMDIDSDRWAGMSKW